MRWTPVLTSRRRRTPRLVGDTARRRGEEPADRPPTWRTPSEAFAVCLHRPNRRRVGAIAAVVGTLLVGINQGSVLAAGRLDWVVGARVVLDYLIPACVSTMGVLAGSRQSAR